MRILTIGYFACQMVSLWLHLASKAGCYRIQLGVHMMLLHLFNLAYELTVSNGY